MLTIIGEAANKLSKGTGQQIAQVDSEDIIGMRSRLVSKYFRVNLAAVETAIPPKVE